MSTIPQELATEPDLRFPEKFLWGAATASFQVEGSTTADGRVPSIWDTFCAKPGAVRNGDTGDPAADHYRLMTKDVQLMAELGLGAYRFSLAWPRIGTDPARPNRTGLDFYRRLVDTLLEHGITPWPTLYHWDLPQSLEDRGGWANRDTAYRFAEYTEAVLTALGDRVDTWTTLNEPWCSAFAGYGSGRHAPGRTEPDAAVASAHHLMLAHGLAIGVIRAHGRSSAGVTLNLFPVHAANPDDMADVEAARRVDGVQNRIFLEPILQARYPLDVLDDLAPYGINEVIKDGDLTTIAAPIDMLGVNYYRDHHVSGHSDAGSGLPSEWVGVEYASFPARGLPLTDSGWETNPGELTSLLVDLHRKYPRLPLYVTENGAAYPDHLTADGTIDDHDRVRFLESHLAAAHAAIDRGVDLRGYFYWSLLDNFEWAEGYAKRFGLVHVDYGTQRRTPKLSARRYSRIIRENGLSAEGVS
ncbi:GH1 family beta-glucosidase [Amycolatopsis sp. YIM 10]|uniref:GH1 family beta-glucosidase n=1 Tax=Amycolatopsis sp. YIM 10 TaxID=2653857 RepID=UPI00128FD884|nr:GH1 family beta-glucosidase [Amycolatopsis sp. YIM 10]QFU89140.1 Beta-glucosidase B [Amycolatopsis sp. YIM 10]